MNNILGVYNTHTLSYPNSVRLPLCIISLFDPMSWDTTPIVSNPKQKKNVRFNEK